MAKHGMVKAAALLALLLGSLPGLAQTAPGAAAGLEGPEIRIVYRGLWSWSSGLQTRQLGWDESPDDLLDARRAGTDAQRRELARFRDRHPSRYLKNGMGIDWLLGEGMAVHLDLHSRRKLKNAGLRIRANGPERVAIAHHRRWSLGAAVDPVRTVEGERYLRMVPQLRLHLDGAAGPRTRCRALIEYGNWRGGGKKATADERVLQASLKMNFY